MNIAVLGSAKSWYVADLRRAAGTAHTITPVTYRQMASSVTERSLGVTSGEFDLANFDAALVRSMPPGSLEQVVFRMDALAQLQAEGTPVVNSPRAIETAVDKYLATAKLQQAGLRVPKTCVCQTADQSLRVFAAERSAASGGLGGDIVVKPLFGGEGRGIMRVSDLAVAHRVFKSLEQIGAVLYLQEFIPHDGADLRLLVIGERVLGMRRRNANDWRTNVSLGATVEPLEVDEELAETAHRAASAVGATIAGVDLLPGRDGQMYALEVNAVPGWKALANVTGVDVARCVLEHVNSR